MNRQGGSRKNRMWKEEQMRILKENLRMLTNIKNIKLKPCKSVDNMQKNLQKHGSHYYNQNKENIQIDKSNTKIMKALQEMKPSVGNHLMCNPLVKVSNYAKDVLEVNNQYVTKTTTYTALREEAYDQVDDPTMSIIEENEDNNDNENDNETQKLDKLNKPETKPINDEE